MDQNQLLPRLGSRATAIVLLAALLTSCARPSTAAAQIVLEDFENASSMARWAFSNGAEFPGSAGGFHRGEGRNGRGGLLDFAFTCVAPEQCGAYVSAELELDAPFHPTPHSVLSFQALPYPGADIAIRLRDESGQVLQFAIAEATIERQASHGWRRLSLPLDWDASEHWGGANNGRISGGIVSVAFLARGGAPMHGALGLDDIRIIDVARQAYQLNPQLGRDPSSLPVDAPEIGVNIANLDNPEAFDAARAAGVSFVRADLTWNEVERDGRFDFSYYDAGFEQISRRGLRALWILDYGHDDHGGGGAVRSESDRAAFRRFASAAAANFRGRGASYEVWNEPDVEGGRYFEPREFTRFVREAAAVVHAADPRAPIATGGVSWGDRAYFASMLSALGDSAPVSAIGLHPYGNGPAEGASGDLGRINTMIGQALERPTPIWITEWGFSSAYDGSDGDGAAQRARQGAELARQMLTAWATHTPVVVWYELLDRGDDASNSEQNFGLLDWRGQPKVTLDAMHAFTQAAAGRRLTGALQDMPEATHGLRLEGASDVVFVLWTEAPGASLTIDTPRPALIDAHDAFGVPLPSAGGTGQSIFTLTEAGGPIYLRVRR